MSAFEHIVAIFEGCKYIIMLWKEAEGSVCIELSLCPGPELVRMQCCTIL